MSESVRPCPAAIRGTDDVRRAIVPGAAWGIWPADVLNNLPRLVAADGLFDHLELVGEWITADPGVRMVLRRLNDPAHGLFAFTLTTADTLSPKVEAPLTDHLWHLLRRVRALCAAGLAGEGTADALGIRWLTGPADDVPWTDHVPGPGDPVDQEPAEMYRGRPIEGPTGALATPAWAGDANLAELFYRWRGCVWSTTQSTWYAVGGPSGPVVLSRMAIIACWASSPGTFQVVFHDSENETDEDYRQVSRTMLPEGQPHPRWGMTVWAGHYSANNWEPWYPRYSEMSLHEDTHSVEPLASRSPDRYFWRDTVIWAGDWTGFADLRRVPPAWAATWQRILDPRHDPVRPVSRPAPPPTAPTPGATVVLLAFPDSGVLGRLLRPDRHPRSGR